eukprot:985926_1
MEDNTITSRCRDTEFVPPKTNCETENLEPDKLSGSENAAKKLELTTFRALYQKLMSDDVESHLATTTERRMVLSIEGKFPIDEVIEVGAVPRLVTFLSRTDNPKLQCQAAWVLTYITSGTPAHTREVVDNGAAQIFVELLSSPDADVREQSLSGLGNIASTSTEFRDLVLDLGIIPPLLSLCDPLNRLSLLKMATWTISYICSVKPYPDFDKVSACIPTLTTLLSMKECSVLYDACWALYHLMANVDSRSLSIQTVVDSGAVKSFVQLIMSYDKSESVDMVAVALMCIGNIVTGDDLQAQAVLNAGGLDALAKLIHHEKDSIRKDVCWALSNITAGNSDQINQVFQLGLAQSIIHLLCDDNNFDVKTEALWAISNAVCRGTPEHT